MLNEQLRAANRALDEKQGKLREVEDAVAALRRKVDQAEEKKQLLQAELASIKQKLQRAGRLTEGISSEGERWRNEVEVMKREIDLSVGDMLVATAMIVYAGPLDGARRTSMLRGLLSAVRARGLPVRADFSLRTVLASDVQIRSWGV